MSRPPARTAQAGFTLMEAIIALAIIGILAAICIPQYFSGLAQARLDKARTEVVTIATAIETYADRYGKLPLTLYQVGYGGRRDPWGVPYCYLNYTDGTGDGLKWAVEAGLVDPNAFVQHEDPAEAPPPEPEPEPEPVAATSPPPTGGTGGSGGGGLLGGGGGGGLLGGVGGVVGGTVETVEETVGGTVGTVVATAEDLVDAVVETLRRTPTSAEVRQLAEVVAKYPGMEIFTSVDIKETRRRDRYMFPLNTDYDLFSLGPNRSTAVSLGHALAQDDVIRANNGGYFGIASGY